MKRQWLVTFAFLGGLFLASAAWAQDPQEPPCAPIPPCQAESLGGPFYSQEHSLWYQSGQASAGPPADATLTATGGPDEYGYTWDDSVPLEWIDVSGGTDTGLDSSTDHVGPIPLGFSFNYYENAYNEVYISRYGFVAFNSNGIACNQDSIPHPRLPNDVIAPHWAPVYNIEGYVRYTTSGEAPDRQFIVEWNRCWSGFPPTDDIYTFELILHENGDIVFQYQTMTSRGNYACQASGIENSTGLDGLAIASLCQFIGSDHAVHIYRPPSARVRLRPCNQGNLSQPGVVESFQQRICNTGDLGTDTFDLIVHSGWPVSFYASDGVTLLTDTDGDGTVDTGPLDEGAEVVVVVKVRVPGTAVLGDSNAAELSVRSSVDGRRSSTAILYTGIGAPFAQVYRDDTDGATSLYLLDGGPRVLKVTPHGYNASDVAIAEAPNRNLVCVWRKDRPLGSFSVAEIEYTLLNHAGEVIRPVSKLTDHSGAALETDDWAPAVAVAAAGHIGLLWSRRRWDPSRGAANYNIHFAVLDAAGNLAFGPFNVTENDAWGATSDYNVPRFYSPRIVATDTNRFVLAWHRQHSEPAGDVDDIYYAVYGTGGTQVRGVTKFTDDSAGPWSGNRYPDLARLRRDRVLLTWTGDFPNDVYYGVLDSAGNVVKGSWNLVRDGASYHDVGADAAQLADGRIVVAWQADWFTQARIRYAVLNDSYDCVAGPAVLDTPATRLGSSYVSVAPASNSAVLTWMDGDPNYRHNLYYALVDSAGDVLTPPMIFRTSQASDAQILSSYEGYGNTSYSQRSKHAPENIRIWPNRGGRLGDRRVNFTATYRDLDGWRDLRQVALHIGTSTARRGNCRLRYDVRGNKLFLLDNTGKNWLGGFAPGSANVIRNRQCTLSCARSTVTSSGRVLRVKWNLLFRTSFRGRKNSYLQCVDMQGARDAWELMGTWRIQ